MKNASMTRNRGLSAFIIALVVLLSAQACGDSSDSTSKEASVSLTEVSPSPAFPGIETSFSFEITPKGQTSAKDLSWTLRFGDGQVASGSELETTATHVYEQSGDYPVELIVKTGGTKIASTNRSLRVIPPLDLAVRNVQASPANVQSGQNLTVSFDVVNQKAAALENEVSATAYAVSNADATAETLRGEEATKLGSQVLTSSEQSPVIEAGGTKSAGLTAKVPEQIQSGDYYIAVWLNPEGQFADSSKQNNLAVSQNIVRLEKAGQNLADISVSNVTVIPTRAFPALNKLRRTFTIANTGGADAAGVEVETYLSVGDDQLDESDDRLIHTSDSMDITVGEETTVNPEQFVLDNEVTAPDEGSTEVYVFVKAVLPQEGLDANTDNNLDVSSPPITVTNERIEGPDIVVDELSISPQNTFLDGTLSIDMSISNEGTKDAGSFFCGIYMGPNPRVDTNQDPRLSNINISGLASNESNTIERSITIPGLYDPGTYYFYVVCDPSGGLQEPYRDNNQKIFSKPIELTDKADVDLQIQSLDIPEQVQEGDTATVGANLCVTGSNPSGPTTAHLFRSASDSLNLNGEPFQTVDIPNINPGKCKTVEISFEASCIDFESSYRFGLKVDVNDVLPESDESNNQLIGTDKMSIDGRFCKCTEDDYEPNDAVSDAASLSTGSISGGLCDPGSCDFYEVDLNATDSLTIETTFPAEKGRLTTTLFGPEGLQSIDRSTKDDRQEVATFLAPEDGTYPFSVCGNNAETRNQYDLTVEKMPVSAGVDIIPYGIELPERESYSIGAELALSFRAVNLGDSAVSSFSARFVISPDQSLGDANDVPLDPATKTIDGIPQSDFKDLEFETSIPTSLSQGTYYIGLIFDPSESLPETNTSNNRAVSNELDVHTRCYDPLEPNDSRTDATPIEAGSYSNLLACTDDSDHYKICVGNAKQMSATVEFNNSRGDIDLKLRDQYQTKIDSSSQGTTNKETVGVDYTNGQQCYYLEVSMLSAEEAEIENTYNMTIDIQDVPPSLQCSGHFESNNTFSSAFSLLSALQQSTKIDRCPQQDTDYYQVDLSSGQTVGFSGTLEPASQSGTLELQLYEPDQTFVESASTGPGRPTAKIEDYKASVGGKHYLQVDVFGDTREVTYTLSGSNLGGIDLRVSDFVIGPGTYQIGDQIRYSFQLANIRSDRVTSPKYKLYLGQKSFRQPGSDLELTSGSLAALDGNSSTTVQGQIPVPSHASSGAQYIHAVVIADGQTDPHEDNNVATTPIQIQ